MIRTLTLERIRLVRFPEDWTRWIVALLFAALAVQSARLLWVLLVPVGPLGDWRPAAPAPLSTDARAAIFASAGLFGSPSQAAASLPNDLKLFGVRAAAGALQGGAIIQLADGQQVSVSVGEAVVPGVQLVAVGFDYADVLREGGRQRLFLDQDKAPETLGQADAASPGTSAPALASALRLSPRSVAAGINGIVVAPGPDAAAFARTGLKPGDVIVAVNGATISSAEDLAQLQQSLSSATSLSLRVERGGALVPLTLNPASPQ